MAGTSARICELIEENPLIAAVKDEGGLKECLEGEISVVFVLYGDLLTIGGIVRRIKESGKCAVVHMDLITGLGGKEIAVDYLKQTTALDGIISTKPALIRRAGELGIFSVLRCFMIDSMAFENLKKQVENIRPDMVEILPGVMPKVLRQITKALPVPVIAGGLIRDREDVMNALGAGATAISTTRRDVWSL